MAGHIQNLASASTAYSFPLEIQLIPATQALNGRL